MKPGMGSCAVGVVVAVLAGGVVAHAQPQPPPAPPPDPPASPGAVVEVPPVPAPAPAPGADDLEVQGLYDQAFAALLKGEHDRAAALFDEVDRRSVDPERRAAARELARAARGLAAGTRAGVISVGAGGGLTLDQSGRASFVVSSTLASFYGSFLLMDFLAVEDYRTGVAFTTGLTGAGFAASLFGTRGRRVTDGMATGYTVGLVSGLANGLLLAPGIGIDPDGEEGDGEVNQEYLLTGLLVMAGGGALGAYLADRHEVRGPQARFAGLMALNGFATTGALLAMAQPDDLESETVTALLALGLDVGLGAGVAFAPRIDWSSSRMTYVSLAEFLGALGGFAVGAMVTGGEGSDDDARTYAGCMLGGLWGGFAAGAHFTRNMAPDRRAPGAKEPARAAWHVVPVALPGGGQGAGIAGAF